VLGLYRFPCRLWHTDTVGKRGFDTRAIFASELIVQAVKAIQRVFPYVELLRFTHSAGALVFELLFSEAAQIGDVSLPRPAIDADALDQISTPVNIIGVTEIAATFGVLSWLPAKEHV
jgi:hypothetical protein